MSSTSILNNIISFLTYEYYVLVCWYTEKSGNFKSFILFQAKTRSAGCAAYMAPERIDPPNPSKPDYDIRADVWSLGITLVELATGHFPYRDCKTDFEVLTKVLQVRATLFAQPPFYSTNLAITYTIWLVISLLKVGGVERRMHEVSGKQWVFEQVAASICEG